MRSPFGVWDLAGSTVYSEAPRSKDGKNTGIIASAEGLLAAFPEFWSLASELEQAANLANMTIPAFCRYFKKLTNKTFTQFVNEFRVAHASSLLADDHLSIAAVSYESGFNNLSHFNKQFKAITGASPREYRKGLKKIVK